ncbi:MAG: MotA/TolQ/ExbB proton channel family protein [Phycisphaerae bacterium]|nr:MotA/TolQ/ExbB proton channel family protein [Phycisphaerae bacterium]
MKQLISLFGQGGIVMILIACVSVIAWMLAFRTWQTTKLILANLEHKSLQSGNKTVIENELVRLDGSINFLAVLAAALPLLGLLGTVLGMLVTFSVIQKYGTGQPSLLASGIRQALLTTQAGLLTALPVLFFHHIISSNCRKISSELNLVFHELKTAGKDNKHRKHKT